MFAGFTKDQLKRWAVVLALCLGCSGCGFCGRMAYDVSNGFYKDMQFLRAARLITEAQAAQQQALQKQQGK